MSHQFTKIPPELLGRIETPLSDQWWNSHQREVTAWVCDDSALGGALRKVREEQNVSLREHAMRMFISAPYLSDLERGHRAWNRHLVATYIKTLPIEPQPPFTKYKIAAP